MNILIVSPGYFPVTKQQGGAIEKLIDNFLEFNEKSDLNISVYSVKNSTKQFDDDIYCNTKFILIDKSKLSFKLKNVFFKAVNKISVLFRKKHIISPYIREVVKHFNKVNIHYDVIIFENGLEYIPYFMKNVKTDAKIVLHLHNDYLNLNTFNNYSVLRYCDEVWTVSKFIKDQVDKVNNLLKTKTIVKVLENPLDEKIFNKKFSLKEQSILKNKLHINDKDFVFIYTGRLIPVKGVKQLVEAFNKLSDFLENTIKIKLLIVGGNANYKNDSSYIKKLKDMSNDNVIFTGFVPAYDLYKYYSIANAQVVPSLWNEAFGLILLEGMYFKLPIIASNSGGMPEVCGDNAYYVNRSNIINELFEQMLFVVKNPLKNKEKILAYKNILQKYTLSNYCNSFLNYIVCLCGDRNED